MLKSYDLRNDLAFLYQIKEAIPNEYIRNRLIYQLEWYMRTAYGCRKQYYAVSCLGLIIPTMILILNTEAWLPIDDNIQHFLIMLLSGAIGVLNGLAELFHWHENMVRYRTNAEKLKSETSLYLCRAGKYSNPDNRDAVFIKNLESISAEENTEWRKNETEGKEEQQE